MRLTVSLIAAMIVAAVLLVALSDRQPVVAQDNGGDVDDVWMDDLDEARKNAIEQKKPMLVVFR